MVIHSSHQGWSFVSIIFHAQKYFVIKKNQRKKYFCPKNPLKNHINLKQIYVKCYLLYNICLIYCIINNKKNKTKIPQCRNWLEHKETNDSEHTELKRFWKIRKRRPRMPRVISGNNKI